MNKCKCNDKCKVCKCTSVKTLSEEYIKNLVEFNRKMTELANSTSK